MSPIGIGYKTSQNVDNIYEDEVASSAEVAPLLNDAKDAIEPAPAPPLAKTSTSTTEILRAIAVVIVFSLHNAWNCFVFLDFTSYKPVEKLLDANASQVGIINSIGWVGILSTLPLVTVCRWHRTLLFMAGLINAAAPALRFYAANTQNYNLMVVSSWCVGSVYGIIGAWPPMLARLMLPKKPHSWTLVTAVASLSNYMGGAVGTTLLPAVTDSPKDVQDVLRLQMYIGGGLGLLMIVWLWIPPVEDPPDKLGIWAELKTCMRWPVLSQILIFGLFIGISLLLQGMNTYIVEESGFSALEGGVANTVYQVVSAVVGIVLGAVFTRNVGVVIKALHVISILSYAWLAVICFLASRDGATFTSKAMMLTSMGILGGSLMGALPFLLHKLIETGEPASENTLCGLIFFVGIAIAAGMTNMVSSIKVTTSIIVIGGMLAVQLLLFVFLVAPNLGSTPHGQKAAVKNIN